METKFTPEQLKRPALQGSGGDPAALRALRPLHRYMPHLSLLGDERDSPRGRIYLIKSMLEGKASPKQVRPHLDRCLSCYSCMTTCPSGVDYMHLSDYARQHIESAAKRPPGDRIQAQGFEKDPAPSEAVPLGLALAQPPRGLSGAFLRDPASKRVAAMLELAPARARRARRFFNAANCQDEKAAPRAGGHAHGLRAKGAAPGDQRLHRTVPQLSWL